MKTPLYFIAAGIYANNMLISNTIQGSLGFAFTSVVLLILAIITIFRES